MKNESAVCVVRLQHPVRAQLVFAPLTHATRLVPANSLSSILETRPFNLLGTSPSNQQSTILLKQFNGWPPGMAPPCGATLPMDVSPYKEAKK